MGKLVRGVNDLYTKNKALAEQWHPTKNEDLTSHDVAAGSDKKVWWKCAAAHEWEARINDRSQGNGCPKCSGRFLIKGTNDLATINPPLASQWHPTKNGALTPKDVLPRSHKKVWWKCAVADHEWEALISNRLRGKGCPKCSGRVVITGTNDLVTINPTLAEQWHPTKNGLLQPNNVMPSANKKVWWICGKGHEWEATLNDRSQGKGCPKCSGRVVITGTNDLATINPVLASQWHPTKNGILKPCNVMPSTNKKVWWICEKEHEWDTTIANRTSGHNCPKCLTGKTEQSFREVFEKLTGIILESHRIDLNRISRKYARAQVDMLNDDLKLVIEYDGAWTHGENVLYKTTLAQRIAEDKETTEALVNKGYNVIRIRNHDRSQKLPFIPIDPAYDSSVFQITYKSFGKNKDSIDELVQRIIKEKADWFKVSNELFAAA